MEKHNRAEHEPIYICGHCASEQKGSPGECCGEPRQLKCPDCGHAHHTDGHCDCGCGK